MIIRNGFSTGPHNKNFNLIHNLFQTLMSARPTHTIVTQGLHVTTPMDLSLVHVIQDLKEQELLVQVWKKIKY